LYFLSFGFNAAQQTLIKLVPSKALFSVSDIGWGVQVLFWIKMNENRFFSVSYATVACSRIIAAV
jgi:hypothetical protein